MNLLHKRNALGYVYNCNLGDGMWETVELSIFSLPEDANSPI